MRTSLAIVTLFVASTAAAEPPKSFDARIEAVRKQAGVPGMAITIVEGGRTTLARGYGVRQLGDAATVDGATIFPTGSTGKAFTSAGLALLVDEGRIRWDDKVIDHLPWFRMYDPYVTREMTVRDLLVHRSGLGLGAGDLLFVPRTTIPRREAVKRLAYIKPATSFRSGYAYDNILYMVAGQLVEEVTGQTWETYTAERLFRRGGMTVSTADQDKRFATTNRAYPHGRLDGGLRGAGNMERLDERDELGRSAAPAGGLSMSAEDMARWLKIQLGRGALPEGGRLFSEVAATEMWNPVVLTPIRPLPGPLAATTPMFDSYALGWTVRDYRGAKVVWHAGGVFGFVCAVVMIPEKNVGFSILTNAEESHLVRGLMFELLDHYLGAPADTWPEKYAAYTRTRIDAARAALAATRAKPAKVGPSLPLARYAGEYADPWYGRIAVTPAGGRLAIDFKSTPRMAGTLEHWQYDTFVTRFADKALEPAYVTFALDADGKPSRVTMKAVSPIADFSWDYHDLLFTPVGAAK
jgi:CubicO group peptidase (beta-lactamase class C family)